MFNFDLSLHSIANSKTYMCRDMKQRGGCPGASCTFAHSQEELKSKFESHQTLPSNNC